MDSPAIPGTAAYKEENYGKAAEHLGRSILTEDDELRGKAYYNLGNALFQLGRASTEPEEITEQWKAAIEHYGEAEKLGGSAAANAQQNREIVEKYLQAMQQRQDDQQQKQDGEKQDDQQQEQDGEKQDQQQDGEKQDDQQQGQDGEKQDQQQDGQPQSDPQKQDGQEQQQENGQPQEEGSEGKPGEEKSDEQAGQEDSSSKEGKEGEEQEGQRLGEKDDQKGEVKSADQSAGDQKDGEKKEVSAYELTPDGKLSEAAARALLESLEREEVKAPYEVRRSKGRNRVIRDW